MPEVYLTIAGLFTGKRYVIDTKGPVIYGLRHSDVCVPRAPVDRSCNLDTLDGQAIFVHDPTTNVHGLWQPELDREGVTRVNRPNEEVSARHHRSG